MRRRPAEPPDRTPNAWWPRLGVLLVLALGMAGCSPEEGESSAPGASSGEDGDWGLFVAARTQGQIPKGSSVRVRFVREQVPDARVGSDAEPDRLRFEPPIEGRASWQNRRELVFEPASPLPSGTRYQAKLSLTGLRGAPASVRTFDFGFEVVPQDFSIEIEELGPDPDDAAQRSLAGRVTTADAEQGARVEKLLSARLDEVPLEVAWTHAPGDRDHRFRIRGIERGERDAILLLRWDGEPLDVDRSGEREIGVPARGRFEVSSVRSVSGNPPHVRVYFSDALDPAQSTEGLVSIQDHTVTTRIEGNTLEVFSDKRLQGQVSLRLEPGLRNRKGGRIEQASRHALHFETLRPAVRFVGSGTILPSGDAMTIPFEAVGVNAVQITAMRIYEDNLAQFLQANTLDGQSGVQRVGRYLWRKTLDLSPEDPTRWERFALDARELLREAPDGMLHLELTVDRRHSAWPCEARPKDPPPAARRPYENWDDMGRGDRSHWDGWQPPGALQWSERDDPCTDAYFYYGRDTRDTRNLLASNLGLLAKRGQGDELHVVVTDLRNAEPQARVELSVYDFQGQPLARGRSGADGFARIALPRTPFLLEARKGSERGYLKLNAAAALTTSHFDVGGDAVSEGVKGHLYGERDVWRPGDDLHLTFVVEDPASVLPVDHPVTLTLFDPRGQEVQSFTSIAPVGRFYPFAFSTADDAPTGRWSARVALGGRRFEYPLRIETVVPNRLAVELDLGESELRSDAMPAPLELSSQWLHGASAADLRADVAVELRPSQTRFARNADFSFDDPARKPLELEPVTVFEGALDAEGRARFELELDPGRDAGGRLQARFTSRVHEEGGGFSSSTTSVPFHPFGRYVGVKPPKGDRARGMLLTDTEHRVEIASVDPDGEPVSIEDVHVRLYKVEWRWWWDRSSDRASLARFVASSVNQPVAEGHVSTVDGRGAWSFKVPYPSWGRYLLRACDTDGGHCSGRIVYVDWPGWAGRAQEGGGGSASVLAFTTDRPEYAPGESALLTLPAARAGRALLAMETGSRLLHMRWVDLEEGENTVRVPITAEMAPTVYASVTLVQPHAGKDNDRPIRLYGYAPIRVEDPETRLYPVMAVPDEIRPRTAVPVDVHERDGRAMTYTLAVVDEGLLGLTGFRTPDLHASFFRREALGVQTWDVFDQVVGAYGGELERLLALGGDGFAERIEPEAERKRFPPVVRFLGPFALPAGGRRHHEVTLPDYLGAVRFMLVAGAPRAYGSVEQRVPVRDPVMLLANLPRVLGPEEEVRLPATVFVTDPSVKRVDVSVQTDARLAVTGEPRMQLGFDEPGDDLAFFDLRAGSRLGMARVELAAASGSKRSTSTIDIPVRAPNPLTQRQVRARVEPGERYRHVLEPHGLPGSNRVAVEVSSVPPLDLERRLGYLMRYPHGCLEQTMSAAFPQLFLPELVGIEGPLAETVEAHVRAAITKLRSFEGVGGGFTYWPGSSARAEWADLYAGHFLVEAGRRGYHVPPNVLGRWLDHARAGSRRWTAGGAAASLLQAYRLYVLALYGSPEIGGMNRLRESGELESPTRWLLASAYARAGLPEAAADVVRGDTFEVSSAPTQQKSFGSATRDRALMLLGLLELERVGESESLVERVSAALASDRTLDTQATAFALLALARAATSAGDVAFEADLVVAGRSPRHIASPHPIYRSALEEFPADGAPVELVNTSLRPLHVTFTTTGVPPSGKEQAETRGLALDVRYQRPDGTSLDLDQLQQGDDVLIEVQVTNPGDRTLEHVALVHPVASGFEIRDPRPAADDSDATPRPTDAIDFQDVRDDRVLTYFSLGPRQSRTLRLRVNAAWVGRFYLPALSVEPMYDPDRYARTAGRWIEIRDRSARRMAAR